jgi:Fe-S cluster assembly iron-binding protein IscA
LQVEVQDSGGNALPGFNVTFTAPSLGASGSFNATSAISQTVLSDSNGRATASQFIANTTSGSYTVRAQVVSTTIFTDFTLINQAGAPFSIEADAGVPLTQVITVSTNFGTNMRVLVKDASGNPVNNATINYSAPASGASGTFNVGNTNTRSLQTGTNGVADPGTFRANSTAGTYNVNVGVQGYPLLSLVFTMTNSPGAPASLTLDTGVPASQTITVTNQFPSNMIVVVRDASNNPIDGVTVNFSAPGSGTSGTFSTGGLNTRSVLTSGGGKADPGIFQANSIAGAYNVTATVSSLNLTFNMTNTAGIANSVTVNASTTPQSAVVSTTFGTNLTVTVRDQHNNPVSGVTVNYSAPTTGARGTFGGSSTTTATSNASGIADPGAFRAGTVAGSYSVTATVSGVATPATFSLTNTAGAASSVTANASTTPQNATVGTAFTNNLRVTVRDQYNNLVNGVTVNYSAPTTGARGTFGAGSTTSANTNTSGVADPGIFTAGTVAGSYTVTATVSGVATPVTFSLTNNPDVPASITRDVSTSPQSAVVSTTFGTNLTVVVRDQYSNALNGVQVNYSAPALTGASGTFVTTLPLTNTISVNTGSNGRADPGGFRANTIAGGPYNVTATVNGTSISTTFALTNTPGTAANVTNDTGVPASQSTARNTAFATNLRVVVTDAYGNIVPNASVTWTAPTTGARGTFSSGATRTVTATAGIADPGTFTANNTAGTYSVTATSGTGSFTFTMTNT